jgi:hypothetical protein
MIADMVGTHRPTDQQETQTTISIKAIQQVSLQASYYILKHAWRTWDVSADKPVFLLDLHCLPETFGLWGSYSA